MRTIIIIILMITSPITCFTQTEKMTIERAISIALQQNLDIKEMNRRLSSSKYEKWASISNGFLPKVDLVQSYTRIDSDTYKRANASVDLIEEQIPPGMDVEIEPFAFKEKYSTWIQVSQPIFNGSSIGAFNLSKALKSQTEASYEELKLEIIYAVKNIYYNLLRGLNTVEILEEKVKATNEHLNKIERMMDVGVASRSDLVRWKLQLAKDEGDLTTAKVAVENLKKKFNNLLDLPLESEFEFIEGDLEGFLEKIKEEVRGDYFDEPNQNHPILLQKKFSIDRSKASRFMAMSGFMPSVNFSFNYGWREDDDLEPDDYKQWNLGLMFNFPLFHSGKNYFKYKSSDELYELSKIEYNKTYEKIKLDNYTANLKLEEEYAQIEISERRVDEANENMKVISKKYDVGVASNLDYIDASVELTYAKLNKINALYSFLIALAEKEKIQGNISY